MCPRGNIFRGAAVPVDVRFEDLGMMMLSLVWLDDAFSVWLFVGGLETALMIQGGVVMLGDGSWESKCWTLGGGQCPFKDSCREGVYELQGGSLQPSFKVVNGEREMEKERERERCTAWGMLITIFCTNNLQSDGTLGQQRATGKWKSTKRGEHWRWSSLSFPYRFLSFLI